MRGLINNGSKNVRLNGRPPHIFTSPNLALFAKSLDTPGEQVSTLDVLKVSTLDVLKVSTLDVVKVSTLDVLKVSTLDVLKVSTLDVLKVSTLDVQKVSTLDVLKVSTLDVLKVSTLDVLKVSTLDVLKVSILDVLKVSTLDVLKVSTLDVLKVSTLDVLKVSTLDVLKVSTLDVQKVSLCKFKFRRMTYSLKYTHINHCVTEFDAGVYLVTYTNFFPKTIFSTMYLYILKLAFDKVSGYEGYSVQLRQNRTYRDHDLTSCAFRRAATAVVSESRRALRVNDVFCIVGEIVLIIAKIISIMHDWRCNGSSAGVEFCRLLPYLYGPTGRFS